MIPIPKGPRLVPEPVFDAGAAEANDETARELVSKMLATLTPEQLAAAVNSPKSVDPKRAKAQELMDRILNADAINNKLDEAVLEAKAALRNAESNAQEKRVVVADVWKELQELLNASR